MTSYKILNQSNDYIYDQELSFTDIGAFTFILDNTVDDIYQPELPVFPMMRVCIKNLIDQGFMKKEGGSI